MKVLFVRSGKGGNNAISTRQGDTLVEKGIEIIYYDIIGKGIFGYLKNIAPLRSSIKKNNPDIIHSHYALTGILTSLTFVKVPIVVSLMGSDVLNTNKFLLFLTRFFSKHFWKHTIVKSQEMFNRLLNRSASIIPNGVDMSIFKEIDIDLAKEELGWNKNLNHILFASSPKRIEKNFSQALKVFEEVKKKKNNIELHCLENLSLHHMVLHYNAADVLLLTSLYEGSPNVIKEAMACNCPIVATNVGDILINTKGTNKVIVTTFDSDEISEALLEILNTEERSNGRENIKNLNSKVIADKIITIYENVLQKKYT